MGLKFFTSLIKNRQKENQEEFKEVKNMVAMGNMNKEEILSKKNIKIGLKSISKYEAIKMAGKLLVEDGYVAEDYIEAMLQREDDLTTYIGNGVAIPHGVGNSKRLINKSGIVVLQFPEGVDFDDEKAYLVIGIAGIGNEHLAILSNIATVIGENEELIKILKDTEDIDYIYKLFTAN